MKPYRLILGLLLLAGSLNAQHDHSGSSQKMHEHHASLNLVKDADATHVSVQSGSWNKGPTWNTGSVPGDGARVIVSEGHTVKLRRIEQAHLMNVRVDGLLKSLSARNTGLTFDTMVISESGAFLVGKVTRPIDVGRSAVFTIEDYNDGFETQDSNSPDYDPDKLGQGIIVHGKLGVYGADKLPYSTFDGAAAGTKTITLDDSPAGWAAGDRLVIAGTSVGRGSSHEEVEIESVNDKNVILTTPLQKNHLLPQHNSSAILKVHVANLTRNVIFKTADEDANVTVVSGDPADKTNRWDEYLYNGHIMFMHTNDATVQRAAFIGLGRTNKLLRADKTTRDSHGTITHIGNNPLARYPIHFHRAGMHKAADVSRCVVENTPSWGYVNHSSHVYMRENVAYNTTGAAFNTEAGDELGAFTKNLSIYTKGALKVGIPKNANVSKENDGGRKGYGFWLHGRAVTVTENVVSGAFEDAYIFWNESPPIDGANDRTLNVDFLPEPGMYGPDPIHPYLARAIFKNNTAYNSKKALQLSWVKFPNSTTSQVIDGFLGWHVETGLGRWYSNHTFYKDIILIGDTVNYLGTGVHNGGNAENAKHKDFYIEGFEVGIDVPRRGSRWTFDSATLRNVTQILALHRPDRVHIQKIVGKIDFIRPTDEQLNGRTYSEITMGQAKHSFAMKTENMNIGKESYTYFNFNNEGWKRAFPIEQMEADYQPFSNKDDFFSEKEWNIIPANWKNKTNRQLNNEFGESFNMRI